MIWTQLRMRAKLKVITQIHGCFESTIHFYCNNFDLNVIFGFKCLWALLNVFEWFNFFNWIWSKFLNCIRLWNWSKLHDRRIFKFIFTVKLKWAVLHKSLICYGKSNKIRQNTILRLFSNRNCFHFFEIFSLHKYYTKYSEEFS